MCGAPMALANVFPLRFPALTGWANVWRAYGARDDSEGAGMKKSGVKPPHSKEKQDGGLKPAATQAIQVKKRSARSGS